MKDGNCRAKNKPVVENNVETIIFSVLGCSWVEHKSYVCWEWETEREGARAILQHDKMSLRTTSISNCLCLYNPEIPKQNTDAYCDWWQKGDRPCDHRRHRWHDYSIYFTLWLCAVLCCVWLTVHVRCNSGVHCVQVSAVSSSKSNYRFSRFYIVFTRRADDVHSLPCICSLARLFIGQIFKFLLESVSMR